MKNKTEKSKELFNELRNSFDTIVMAGDTGSHMAIGMKGTDSDILYAIRQLVKSLREDLTDRYGETITAELLKTIIYTDDELAEADRKLTEEIDKMAIPEWLKKLMHRDDEEDEEDDDEDGTDVQDDSVDTEEEAVRKAVDALVKALRNCDSN